MRPRSPAVPAPSGPAAAPTCCLGWLSVLLVAAEEGVQDHRQDLPPQLANEISGGGVSRTRQGHTGEGQRKHRRAAADDRAKHFNAVVGSLLQVRERDLPDADRRAGQASHLAEHRAERGRHGRQERPVGRVQADRDRGMAAHGGVGNRLVIGRVAARDDDPVRLQPGGAGQPGPRSRPPPGRPRRRPRRRSAASGPAAACRPSAPSTAAASPARNSTWMMARSGGRG